MMSHAEPTNQNREMTSRQAIYSITVVALASFVLLLPFLTRPEPIYTAELKLTAIAQPENQAFWGQYITPELAFRAAQELGLKNASADLNQVTNLIKKRLRFETQVKSNHSTATIRFYYGQKDIAKQFLETFAEHILSKAASDTTTVLDTNEVADARLAVAAARQAIADFDRAAQEAQDRFADVETRLTSVESTTPFERQTPNSDTDYEDDTETKLASVKSRLQEYILLVGDDHVIVRNLRQELKTLEEAADQQAETLPEPTVDPDLVATPAPQPPQIDFEKRDELRLSLDTALTGLAVAQNKVSPTVDMRITGKPFIAEQRNGSFTLTQILWASVSSLFLGILVHWLHRSISSHRRILNQKNLADASGAPVLGSVFPTRQEPQQNWQQSIRIGNAGVRIAEYTLILFVVFLVFCIVVDPSFPREFRLEPFSAYASAFRTHLWLGS